MVRAHTRFWLLRLGRLMLAATMLVAFVAADRPKTQVKTEAETVELFAGIEQGQIEAQVIPKDSTRCTLLVTNKTDKPLSVQLPVAFAAVPALAQFLPLPQPPAQPPNNSPQRLGVGADPLWGPLLPGPGAAPGPMGVPPQRRQGLVPRPGPIFNIAPEQVGKVKLPAVCLDHGNPNPRPQIRYELKPLDSVTQKEGVAELCAMMARKDLSQRIAQLATWHLANDLSWEKLGSQQQKLAFGTRPSYTRDELSAAKKAAEKAVKAARESKAPGDSKADSLSRK